MKKLKLPEKLITKIGHWLTRQRKPIHSYLCDFDRLSFEVRPGDVLLVEGRSHISSVIQAITLSPWSHAALYIGRIHDVDDPTMRKIIKKNYHNPGNKQLIIESQVGDGTFIREMRHYKHDHVRICRPQGLSREDAQQVISHAISHVGREYNLRHIFDLARLMFPWNIMPRRWRSIIFEHNALKPTQEICSLMIAEAFQSVNFPVLPVIRKANGGKLELIPRNPYLYTPSDFDYSPYFSIIKYPIFSLNQHAHYRELPWQHEKMSDDYDIIEAEQSNERPNPPKTKNND